MDDLLGEFQALLAQFKSFPDPENRDDLGVKLAEISKLLNLNEKILTYIATHRDMADDLITYLFEYKQLLKLEDHLKKLQYSLPLTPPPPPQKNKPWWKIRA